MKAESVTEQKQTRPHGGKKKEKNLMKRKRILVVEDEPGIRKTLSLRLRGHGFDVSVAANGLEGLEISRRQTPDLVILDLLLPKLSGEEVCKAIREDEDDTIASIPIIMLTGKDTLVDRVVGKVIGANAYLTKPFEFESLLQEMHKQGIVD